MVETGEEHGMGHGKVLDFRVVKVRTLTLRFSVEGVTVDHSVDLVFWERLSSRREDTGCELNRVRHCGRR